jgi:hypothetical protein
MSTNAQKYALITIPNHPSLNGYINWVKDKSSIYGLVTGSPVWELQTMASYTCVNILNNEADFVYDVQNQGQYC